MLWSCMLYAMHFKWMLTLCIGKGKDGGKTKAKDGGKSKGKKGKKRDGGGSLPVLPVRN